MTELITAEELVDEHPFIHSSSGGKRADRIRLVQKAQRNTLEAAAKAVCGACDRFGKPMRHAYNGKWLHSSGECCAAAVWELIPTDPAPAGEVES